MVKIIIAIGNQVPLQDNRVRPGLVHAKSRTLLVWHEKLRGYVDTVVPRRYPRQIQVIYSQLMESWVQTDIETVYGVMKREIETGGLCLGP